MSWRRCASDAATRHQIIGSSKRPERPMKSIRTQLACIARSSSRPALPALIALMAAGWAIAGCSGGSATTPGWSSAPMAAIPAGAMQVPSDEQVTAAWKSRPGYVQALPDAWSAAYRFALERPDVLQWLPCYCGCGGMGHRSNLDCFFQQREAPGNFTFEEHGSYCDICVETANLAKRMVREGRTISEIRAAVDATFGGGAVPGTDTQLPPGA
jgi:hypothetical protein